MRIIFLSLLVLFVLPVSAQAADVCKKAASTADIMKCKTARHEDVQNALKTRFDALVKSKTGDELQVLRDIQAEWLNYRDSECALEADQASEESLRRIQELRCLIRVSEERLMALENLEAAEEPHEVTEISSQPRWINALIEDHSEVYWSFADVLEGDFDCDDEVEYALTGVRFNKEEPLVQPVVIISENPSMGRPQNAVLDIVPKSPEGDAQEPAISCSVSKALVLGEIEEPEEGQCGKHVLIKDQKCPEQALKWDGKSYVLD